MPLLSHTEHRAVLAQKPRRKLIGADELWRRAAHAATIELSGARWSDDERDEVTADVVACTLAKLLGTYSPPRPPRRRMIEIDGERVPEPAHRRAVRAVAEADRAWQLHILAAVRDASPTVAMVPLMRRAKDARERIETRRKHEASLAAAEGFENPAPPIIGLVGARPREVSENVCRWIAERLDLDLDWAPHLAVAWRFARDLPEGNEARTATITHADAAREIEQSPAAYQKNCERGAAALARDYPDPSDLLRLIVGHEPVARLDPNEPGADGAPSLVLWYGADDTPWPREIRRELDWQRHRNPPAWREGTGAGGERVKRHADRAAARAASRVRPMPGRKIDLRRARSRPLAERLAARRAIARAYRAESIARDGTRKQRTNARDPRAL